MNQKDRDDLLSRLDERTTNIYHLIEKVEQHNAIQNGQLLKVVQACGANTTWRKIGVWSGGIMVTVLIPLFTLIFLRIL